MIDLRNTREEAISVAELKSNQLQVSTSTKTEKEEMDYQTKLFIKTDDMRRTSTTSEKSMDQDDDDDKEPQYRLDPKLVSKPFELCFIQWYIICHLTVFLLCKVCECQDPRTPCANAPLLYICE